VRAVLLDAAGSPGLVDVPEPDGQGALVSVDGCGLCGSDVEKLGRGAAVVGHEIDGRLADGTRVTVLHRISCGDCERCRAGHESTCEEFMRIRIDPGGFAERVRAASIIRLPVGLPALAGVWAEPLGCIVRALDYVPRGRVLVVGCGAIGQLWVQALLRRGDDVTVAEPRADRRAAAEALGATAGGGLFDAAVLTAAGGLNEALERLEAGGTLLAFAGSPEPVPFAVDVAYRRELRLVGSRSATVAAVQRALELLPELQLPDAAVLPLERFAEGVEMYRRGEVLKVVFTP
jgi:L-iditol 2-dehydrogenase